MVFWYFNQLDSNGSEDINKKEMKPFKRYVKKKAKPKKCARKFTDYCDLNKDKSISLTELKGCLGVRKDPGRQMDFLIASDFRCLLSNMDLALQQRCYHPQHQSLSYIQDPFCAFSAWPRTMRDTDTQKIMLLTVCNAFPDIMASSRMPS